MCIIGTTGLGPIIIKFRKVIICFETWGPNIKYRLLRLTTVFFPNVSHHFYLTKTKYKGLFKKYHDIINNYCQINTPKLLPLNECITYYNKFLSIKLLYYCLMQIEMLIV
jgi:hypothetical protein